MKAIKIKSNFFPKTAKDKNKMNKMKNLIKTKKKSKSKSNKSKSNKSKVNNKNLNQTQSIANHLHANLKIYLTEKRIQCHQSNLIRNKILLRIKELSLTYNELLRDMAY